MDQGKHLIFAALNTPWWWLIWCRTTVGNGHLANPCWWGGKESTRNNYTVTYFGIYNIHASSLQCLVPCPKRISKSLKIIWPLLLSSNIGILSNTLSTMLIKTRISLWWLPCFSGGFGGLGAIYYGRGTTAFLFYIFYWGKIHVIQNLHYNYFLSVHSMVLTTFTFLWKHNHQSWELFPSQTETV